METLVSGWGSLPFSVRLSFWKPARFPVPPELRRVQKNGDFLGSPKLTLRFLELRSHCGTRHVMLYSPFSPRVSVWGTFDSKFE